METGKPPAVALFIPCLVDQVYPEMGLAMARILEHLGCEVRYDPEQTCCGQPAFNAGHREEATEVAGRFLDVFGRVEPAEAIVCPSGSCTAMVRNYYPFLFRGGPREGEAGAAGRRVFEFSEFLARRGLAARVSGTFPGKVGFHNSCHACRELRLAAEPLALLRRVSGCEAVEPDGEPVCCGFGGLFSVKFEAIAGTMARTRLEQFTAKGIRTLVSNDPGCILHLRQEAASRGLDLEICHLAEFLARALRLRGFERNQ
jgi:L-lactate dehydrogenase complex protein LldE